MCLDRISFATEGEGRLAKTTMLTNAKTSKSVLSATSEALTSSLSLVSMCDDMSREQSHVSRGATIREARERVLSAKSREMTSPNLISHTDGVSKLPLSRVTSASTNQSDASPQLTFRSELDESQDRKLTSLSGDSVQFLTSYVSLAGASDKPRSSCVRERSAFDRDAASSVNSLSRQCCDVLGVTVCRHCSMQRRRMTQMSRNEASPVTQLDVTEKNFADALVLRRLLPHLTPAQIDARLHSGDISRLPLRERLYEKKRRMTSSLRTHRSTPTTSSQRPLAAAGQVSSTFFVNIQDLNNKLLMRQLKSSWSESRDNFLNDVTLTRQRKARSVDLERQDRLKTFYDPPLVPRVCQNSEPAFFAGTSDRYKLPDRLPDQVVSGQISDMASFNPAWTEQNS